jgi:hypothetical protein
VTTSEFPLLYVFSLLPIFWQSCDLLEVRTSIPTNQYYSDNSLAPHCFANLGKSTSGFDLLGISIDLELIRSCPGGIESTVVLLAAAAAIFIQMRYRNASAIFSSPKWIMAAGSDTLHIHGQALYISGYTSAVAGTARGCTYWVSSRSATT